MISVPWISLLLTVITVATTWGFGWTLMTGVMVGGILHAPVMFGLFHPKSSMWCRTVHSGSRGRPHTVALTFDDGPCPKITRRVLDTLEDHAVPATFFCVGRAARRHPELVRAIVNAGHEIGNHSFCHPRHVYLWSRDKLERDTRLTQRVLERSAGVRPGIYRPPVGFRSTVMKGVMDRLGLTIVTFSFRSLDTLGRPWASLVRRVVQKCRPGSILVFHDGGDQRAAEILGREAMLQALPAIIRELRSRGYRFATVSDLLSGARVGREIGGQVAADRPIRTLTGDGRVTDRDGRAEPRKTTAIERTHPT